MKLGQYGVLTFHIFAVDDGVEIDRPIKLGAGNDPIKESSGSDTMRFGLIICYIEIG